MLKDEYIQANGLRFHYVTTGAGELILFLHGFPEFWYAWRNQLTEFSKDRRAVAPDMRGFNLSEKPSSVSEYRIEALIEDVRALGHQLSQDKAFVLVGHDWGGYIGWRFAMAYPETLHRLVIINAPHPAIFARLLSSDPDQQKASGYMELFRSEQAAQILSANDFEFLKRVMAFGRENGLSPEDRPEYIKAWSQPGAITGGLNYYRANHLTTFHASDHTPTRSAKIDVPTLVIWGMNDPALLPQNLEGLEEYVPQLTIHRIPDASHWLIHTHSAQVNACIKAYLS